MVSLLRNYTLEGSIATYIVADINGFYYPFNTGGNFPYIREDKLLLHQLKNLADAMIQSVKPIQNRNLLQDERVTNKVNKEILAQYGFPYIEKQREGAIITRYLSRMPRQHRVYQEDFRIYTQNLEDIPQEFSNFPIEQSNSIDELIQKFILEGKTTLILFGSVLYNLMETIPDYTIITAVVSDLEYSLVQTPLQIHPSCQLFYETDPVNYGDGTYTIKGFKKN